MGEREGYFCRFFRGGSPLTAPLASRGKGHRISSYDFYREIADLPSGRDIAKCIQCGTCSGSCPVLRHNHQANPRRIIAMALLGLKEEVLRSEAIWLCAKCQECVVKCIKDVRPGEIMGAIRTLAIRQGTSAGWGMRHTRAFAHDILRFGKLNEATLPLVTVRQRVLKMIPMAVKMMLRRKLPPPFPHRIKGLEQVRALFRRFGEETK